MWQVLLLLALAGSVASAQEYGEPSAPGGSGLQRPNLLLIVADDLGYSDLGSFGGEAQTPNLDALAYAGLRLTNFHAAPSCSPSRAQLLSGADNHRVGLGNMAELLERYPWQQGRPGYEGYLTRNAHTVASALQARGYRTYMSGKWHMGHEAGYLPTDRGFDRAFALMGGTSSHFAADNGRENYPTQIVENGQEVDWPAHGYSSDVYVDKLLEYLETDDASEAPFFAYLAFTAPHHPLHAPAPVIAKYVDKYLGGYEQLMQERIRRMRTLGIIPDRDTAVFAHPRVRPWASLTRSERARESRAMAVYAAMLDSMDHNIGRVIEHLQQCGQLENTVIVFLSDNGANAQDLASFPVWKQRYEASDNSPENIGAASSWMGLGAGWAQAVTAPYRLAKHRTSEGGIRVPAVIWHANMEGGSRISESFTQIRDIAPTLLDFAGIKLESAYFRQRGVEPWTGQSLRPLADGIQQKIHDPQAPFGWEHRDQFALIKGDWKILKMPKPMGTGNWELLNLRNDRAEVHDLSSRNPGKFSELTADWENYVSQNNVLLRPVDKTSAVP